MTARMSLLLVSGLFVFAADEEPIVFRSDVALVRVDAQVVDRNNRAITGLQKEDFVIFEGGQKREIRNFEAEDMPMDVLLLLDVSGSMQAHIERVAAAADQALRVLGADDRVGIMVFDRATRLRYPFRKNGDGVVRELENVLNQESFDGGTDIPRGLVDAAIYMERNGRRNARHAIVILTDDQTERGRDDVNVMRALTRADAVLSALIAPDAMGMRSRRGGGNWPNSGGSGGGGWPTSGGGMGGPLGGIIFGRRGPYGGYPSGGGGGRGPVILGRGTSSAGTEEIARRSGGDSMRVDESAALEETLMRLRQRYALHFNLADGASGAERDIEVQLTSAAQRRYPGSETRYRRAYLSTDNSQTSSNGRTDDSVMVSRTPTNPRVSTPDDQEPSPRLRKRRPAVNDDGTRVSDGPLRPDDGVSTSAPAQTQTSGGWRRSDDPAPASEAAVQNEPNVQKSPASDPTSAEQPQQGGWRRVKPGEQP